jgi:hypothetical protein
MVRDCGLPASTKGTTAAMTKQAKKREERFFLDQFIVQTGRWQVVREGKPPEPDFFVSDARGLLGVELTSVQKDAAPGESSAATARERNRAKFLRRAAEHYYTHGGTSIHVQAAKLPPAGLDLEDLTRRLKESRECALATVDQVHEFEITANNDPDQLPIAEFRVRALDPVQFPRYDRWQAVENSVGWVRQAPADFLVAAVRRKAEAKLPNYKTAVDRVALLIYADRTKSSGMIQLPPDARLADACGFVEVHLFLPPEQVLQLA